MLTANAASAWPVSQLEVVSPLATLAGGYSVTQPPCGKLLKSTKQAQLGERLETYLLDGWIESEVKSITTAKTRDPMRLFEQNIDSSNR